MEFVFPVLGQFIHPVVYLIVTLTAFLPGFAVAVRRLHDVDRSGWWSLLWLIPLAGWLVLVIFCVKRGSPGTNSYGPPAR
jgi:uncharacterized membrane protein YhaH (DUF805 family)